MSSGKFFLIGILAITAVVLVVLTMKTINFAETAQENKFKCQCTLPNGEKTDLVLSIDTSDKYTPAPLKETIFNIDINNSSVPCSCSR